jgi:hypothetical protein
MSAAAPQTESDKDFTIIVNAQKKTVENRVVTYEQAVQLAFPNGQQGSDMYTVTYRKAEDNKSGTLVPGGTVTVKNGTIFDVTPTNKS